MARKLCFFASVVLTVCILVLFQSSPRNVWVNQPRPLTQSLTTATEAEKRARASQGYLLALHFSDQLTASSANVLSLQCWAQQSNLVVVEPFVVHSWLGASLKTGLEGAGNGVRLSDVYDIDVWQQHSKQKGYSRLAGWEEFLSSAPRDVVIASQPPSRQCDLELLEKQSLPFTSAHNFTIVRKVCFNFQQSGSLTSKQFFDKLYGSLSPHEVTVIFDRWGGILPNGNQYRMVVSDNDCVRKVHEISSAAKKSNVISKDAKKYVSSFLNGSEEYTAIMIRFGYFVINHNFGEQGQEKQFSLVDNCLRDITSVWQQLKAKYSLQNIVLLATDYGKHGSKFEGGAMAGRSRFAQYPWMEQKIQTLFRDIYGSSLSMKEWEGSFESVVHRNSSGYIAQVQKELAANARCLVLAGANGRSSYQQQAKVQFENYRDKSKPKCFAKACN